MGSASRNRQRISGAEEKRPWRSEVEDWLAGVGLWVARLASFRLGLIGFEVSGETYAADITLRGIPAERFIGYLWPSGGWSCTIGETRVEVSENRSRPGPFPVSRVGGSTQRPQRR
jgi:hypothetical protein